MKLIILDRDGVINHDSDDYVKNLDEFQFIPGSIEAIAQLSKAGYTIAVATNQSGIARGYYDVDTLEAMHTRLRDCVAAAGGHIAHIAYCPHAPDAGCTCRKPLPGLIDQICQQLNVSAKGSILVGDSLRDLQAGVQRGCRPYLVRTGKGATTEAKLKDYADWEQVSVFDDLPALSNALLEN